MVCCKKPCILVTIYPVVLAFLTTRTVEVYSCDSYWNETCILKWEIESFGGP